MGIFALLRSFIRDFLCFGGNLGAVFNQK
jgi:hypothetical protein